MSYTQREIDQTILRWKTDRRSFFRDVLHVVTSGGLQNQVVPFELWYEQAVFLDWVEDRLAAGVPVRAIIDKARQLGFSLLTIAIFFHAGAFWPYLSLYSVAHKDDNAGLLARYAARFNDHLRPEHRELFGAEASNFVKRRARTFVWPRTRSVLTFQTQGATDFALGDSISMFQGSEVSRWGVGRRHSDAEDVLTGVEGTLPDIPGTIGILESTAFGSTGMFYERFQEAYDHIHDPTHLYKPFFFSFVGVPKYEIPDTAYERRMDRAMKHSWALAQQANAESTKAAHLARARKAAEELGYIDQVSGETIWFERACEYDLQPKQVKWAIRKYASLRRSLDRFDREFPITFEISFTSSGRPVFDARLTAELRVTGRPPGTRFGSELFKTPDGSWDLNPGGVGWEVYEAPKPGYSYVIGVDASEGTDGGDWSAMDIICRQTMKYVASFRAKTSPEDLAEQVLRGAVWYNRAFVVPELNNHGHTVVFVLTKVHGYRNVYRRSHGWVKPGERIENLFGWKTGPASRGKLIEQFRRAYNGREVHPVSPAFFKEAGEYRYTRADRPDHPKGGSDDQIFAHALAYEGTMRLGRVPSVPAPQRKAPPKGTGRLLNRQSVGMIGRRRRR